MIMQGKWHEFRGRLTLVLASQVRVQNRNYTVPDRTAKTVLSMLARKPDLDGLRFKRWLHVEDVS